MLHLEDGYCCFFFFFFHVPNFLVKARIMFPCLELNTEDRQPKMILARTPNGRLGLRALG